MSFMAIVAAIGSFVELDTRRLDDRPLLLDLGLLIGGRRRPYRACRARVPPRAFLFYRGTRRDKL
jgi:hypothetical protein